MFFSSSVRGAPQDGGLQRVSAALTDHDPAAINPLRARAAHVYLQGMSACEWHLHLHCQIPSSNNVVISLGGVVRLAGPFP